MQFKADWSPDFRITLNLPFDLQFDIKFTKYLYPTHYSSYAFDNQAACSPDR